MQKGMKFNVNVGAVIDCAYLMLKFEGKYPKIYTQTSLVQTHDIQYIRKKVIII